MSNPHATAFQARPVWNVLRNHIPQNRRQPVKPINISRLIREHAKNLSEEDINNVIQHIIALLKNKQMVVTHKQNKLEDWILQIER